MRPEGLWYHREKESRRFPETKKASAQSFCVLLKVSSFIIKGSFIFSFCPLEGLRLGGGRIMWACEAL